VTSRGRGRLDSDQRREVDRQPDLDL